MRKPKFFMLVGLPASGKSTLAQLVAKEHNANIHSSDEIRQELSGDINNQNINELVFKTLHNRIKEDLQNGKNCIYDATNISYKRRMSFLQELNKISCKKICIVMATPYARCLSNNADRERQVPNEIIERMYRNFDMPYWYEGWDDIKIHYYPNAKGIYGTPAKWTESVIDYNQNNSHHNLTLGLHCLAAWKYITNYIKKNYSLLHRLLSDLDVYYATLIHDNGKPFCKTFKNSKGEITEQAHYYSHERVGSYNSLFYTYGFGTDNYNILYIAVLIRWHMQLYFIKDNAKALSKYKKLWGNELYSDILLLHKADKHAH